MKYKQIEELHQFLEHYLKGNRNKSLWDIVCDLGSWIVKNMTVVSYFDIYFPQDNPGIVVVHLTFQDGDKLSYYHKMEENIEPENVVTCGVEE